MAASVAPTRFLSIEIGAPDRGVVPEKDVFLIFSFDDDLDAIGSDQASVMRVLGEGLCLTQLQSWIKSLLKRGRIHTCQRE
jgi:hypothetical protein